MRQIFRLAKSELIKTYKGAALGPLWALIRPAITIFVYWFAFSIGLRSNKDVRGVPFFLFLTVGMIPWFFMSDAILGGASSFRTHKAFVTKMRFPVSTIPTYKLLSMLYTHIALTVLTYILLLCCGVKPSIYNIQILFYMPMMYAFFVALTWITAPISAISKDFSNLLRAIINAIFWLSGIIWDPYSLKMGALRRIVLATPVSYFSNGYRNTFLYEKWFFETRYETFCLGLWFIFIIVVGTFTYKRLRRSIPDVL